MFLKLLLLFILYTPIRFIFIKHISHYVSIRNLQCFPVKYRFSPRNLKPSFIWFQLTLCPVNYSVSPRNEECFIMWLQFTFVILCLVPWSYLLFPSPWPFVCYFLSHDHTVLSLISVTFHKHSNLYKLELLWWCNVVPTRSSFRKVWFILRVPRSGDSRQPSAYSVTTVALRHAKLPCPRSCLLPMGNLYLMTGQWRETKAQSKLGQI